MKTAEIVSETGQKNLFLVTVMMIIYDPKKIKINKEIKKCGAGKAFFVVSNLPYSRFT